MPDHEPREIEKLLRASAEARRSLLPPDAAMPGPMRSALQREVSRVLGGAPAADALPASWFSILWPQLAGVFGVLVLGAAIFLLARETAPVPLASQSAMEDRFAPIPPLSMAPGERVRSGGSLAKRQDESTADQSSQPEAMAAFSAPAEAPPARRERLSLADDASNGDVALKAQVFAQQAREAKLDAAPSSTAEVLQRFTVERLGEEIRIVDGDGSVYLGGIRLIEPASEALGNLNELESPEPVENVAGAFRFEASGFNRSLGKRVKIAATYQPAAAVNDKPATALLSEMRGALGRQNAAPAGESARIIGEVLIDGAATPVRAVLVETP